MQEVDYFIRAKSCFNYGGWHTDSRVHAACECVCIWCVPMYVYMCVCVFKSPPGNWQGNCPLHHESVKMRYLILFTHSFWGVLHVCHTAC